MSTFTTTEASEDYTDDYSGAQKVTAPVVVLEFDTRFPNTVKAVSLCVLESTSAQHVE